MTVGELARRLNLTARNVADPSREVTGGYCGDLLSWVMGRAGSGSVWITIMSNANVAAVALLADCAAVILAEDVPPDPELIAAAAGKGINLFSSPRAAFDLCAAADAALADG